MKEVVGMENITLEFLGPYKFFGQNDSIFTNTDRNLSGIYLWTINTKDGYMIRYVGQTKYFFTRQKAHLINFLGLNYGILDVEAAKNGKRELLWNGLWRDKDNRLLGNDLENEYTVLSKRVIDYINIIEIFFAKLDGQSNLRKHIEGYIGCNLRENHKEFKELYADDFRIGKSTKLNCKLFIKCNYNILGLDKEIDV
jgi:hypothetical protein